MAYTDTEHQHIGAKVIDSRGHQVGKVDNVFYDDRTLEARWIAVNLGALHRKTPLVPLQQAYFSDNGSLVVPFPEEVIKHAPIAHEAAPTSSEADEVARYYDIAQPSES